MDSRKFSLLRKRLGVTQKDMGRLLGVSLSAIHAYEQGWRKIPPHVERQTLFLLAWRQGLKKQAPCWEILGCPRERREGCPAWQFRIGQLCWFVNGCICEGRAQRDWDAKMEICWQCDVLRRLLGPQVVAAEPVGAGSLGPDIEPPPRPVSARTRARLPSDPAPGTGRAKAGPGPRGRGSRAGRSRP